MHIQFKGANYELASDVTARAQRKIGGLKKYLGKYDGTTNVFAELGKETQAHQSGSIWRASLNLTMNGERFHADATDETIENAIDRAVAELAAELQSARLRRQTQERRGGSILKRLLRGISAS